MRILKVVGVILVGSALLAGLNHVLGQTVGLTHESMNVWISRIGYILQGGALYWAIHSGKR